MWISENARIPPQTPPAGRIQNLAEFQKTFSRGKAESVSPNFCFRFSESVWISTLVERGRKIKIKKNVEREISFNHLDLARSNFELCPIDTARKRNQDSREKMRRREAPMIELNSRQTQTPPRFSTLRVALRCQYKCKNGKLCMLPIQYTFRHFYLFEHSNG